MKLRPPRFTLKTLLATVFVVAVAVWAYWVMWPSYQAYRESVEFAERVKTLRAGPSQDLFKILPNDGTLTQTQMFSSDGQQLSFYGIQMKYSWYCVCLDVKPNPRATRRQLGRIWLWNKETWKQVRVFRLPPRPRSLQVNDAGDNVDHDNDYLQQFYLTIAGRSDRFDRQYELIHSDAAIDQAKVAADGSP